MKKPTVFGKYLLLERLNVGGMAEVFVAKAFGVEGFERILAIKKILPTMAEDEEFITMFIDEARISVQLNHPNVVHIHELGKHDDAYYIAMEYVPGKDLRTIIERYKKRRELMPTSMAAFIASKMCEGLDYAHRKKDARGQDLLIIHRDVSPQNILLSYEGELKIIDFGIAKAANRSQKTQAGILKGKFGYMSPEQVRGLPIDRRSDIFAVGVIFYELLTGEKLFVGESDFSTLEKVRAAEVPLPRKFNPNITPALEKVVLKALARETEDRYQWPSDLQEDLMKFLMTGDAFFSPKHLSTFMKDAFADDLVRENEKMERYSTVEKPDSPDPTGIMPAMKSGTGRKPTAPQMPIPGISKVPRNTGQNVVIPPPSEEELAEMAPVEKTMIVSAAEAEAMKTSIGISPFAKPAESKKSLSEDLNATMPPMATHKLPRAQDIDMTMPPKSEPRAEVRALPKKVADDTGHDLRPIDMTGFRPVLESQNDLGEVNDTGPSFPKPEEPAERRPKFVIGDAPVSGATSIGPSPFAGRLQAEPDDEEIEPEDNNDSLDNRPPDQSYDDSANEPDEASDDQDPAPSDSLVDEDRERENNTNQKLAPVPARKPSKAIAKPGAKATKKKSKLPLIIGISAVVLIALGGIVVAATKVGVPSKVGIFVKASPSGIPYTIQVNPGKKNYNNSGKPIEVGEPGEYTLDIRPANDAYGPVKKTVTVKSGIETVLVTFPKAAPAEKPVEVVGNAAASEDAGTTVAVASTYAATISTDSPGAEVAVDGKSVPGVTPLTIRDLSASKSYSVDVKKQGFETLTFVLENPEKRAELEKKLILVKEAKAEVVKNDPPTKKDPPPEKAVKNDPPPKKDPPPEKVVKNDPPPKQDPPPEKVVKNDPPPKKDPPPEKVVKNDPPPKKDPPPEKVVKNDPPPKETPKGKVMGKMMCTTTPIGADVFIDGKNTGKKTPVAKANAFDLSGGKHKVQFKLNGKTLSKDIVIDETHTKDKPFLLKETF
jgi:eukaryotic-like serine/threonine-protein kinase